jgi:glutamyl-tRNA synthetase
MRKTRVRYAPSPTGPQHIGGIRTALYNYLFAKKIGGDFILRIEDTDQKRFVEGAEQYIINSMEWCGIAFDEGPHIGGPFAPYRQSERSGIYKQYAQKLLDEGNAYYAFDTAEDLDELRKKAEANKSTFKYDAFTREDLCNSLTLTPKQVEEKLNSGAEYTIRIKTPLEETILVNDIIRGEVIFNSSELDDKVIFKSDGLPTYHLANVVDDYLMEITHVIRGEEWLPSAPLHVLLYQMLGWENRIPQMAHLPLLLKPNGKGKLSKRDGDAMGFPVFPLEWTDPKTGEKSSGYRENGYFPDAFLNIMAFLGWNPGNDKEIYDLEGLIDDFSLERVSKSGAKFDPEKAKWFNQQFLWQKSNADLSKHLQEYLDKNSVPYNVSVLELIAQQMKERVNFVHEMYTNAKYLYQNPIEFDTDTIAKRWKDESAETVAKIKNFFENSSDFTMEVLESSFKEFLQQNGINMGLAMIGTRLCLSGQAGGPNVFAIAQILGKNEVIHRLNNNVAVIEKLR